ncbi:MAG: EAL domain-containing protein, partial [Clostridiales bacterium]|nr:EAL domain-containing protein [Clostridiales bacterium]
ALEQSVLEKISANFVSFSQENAKEKVDEMFEMSAGLLKFDFAYVLKVDSDHKGAYILNSYANCDTTGASYIHNPGEKISDEIFIVIETVITHKQPTLLEDTAGVSIREYLGARNHFMSKGVRALAALPVILDGDVYGILVVEYREHAVSNVWENRINILKILANLMADAEKKLLYERQLHDFAYFDETTGMPNLNMLRETLKSMMSVERESGGIALLDIEIENLKTIYDTFGRDIYIKMNRKIASILKNLFDDSIMLSKTGDEEFIAVLPYCENNEDIIKRAQEVIDAFSSPMLIESGIEELFAIVNVGIALYPKDGKDVNALLESAELAGYEAEKSDSKFAFYNPQIKDNITETALLTNRLFRALQNGEFYLKFQPQINCRSEKTAGLEALLRLKDEDGKIVGPSRFVPILERTGLIYDVGQWVLRESIATHQRLVRKGFPPLRFSVNVSVLQFRRRDFVDIVSKIIEESRIDPQYIELELTESSLSDNLPETAEKIEELKKLGVSVAIDDFGKGYSSLHRLEIIHFDRIKIDKSIINNITLEPARGVVTKMIISLAEALDVYTIVEGVETKEQSDYLKHLGCTEIQGFYYSKPLSIEELEEFLRKEMQ